MLSMTIPAVAKLDRARSRHQYATLPPCRPALVTPIEANILRYCDAHSTSELGHSRPGQTSGRSSHVRFAPKATVSDRSRYMS